MSDISDTLKARASQHGDFAENAAISQSLKAVMERSSRWAGLSPFAREALHMIQHKVGRILAGDPTYADHWHDIAGYATLVENRLPLLLTKVAPPEPARQLTGSDPNAAPKARSPYEVPQAEVDKIKAEGKI